MLANFSPNQTNAILRDLDTYLNRWRERLVLSRQGQFLSLALRSQLIRLEAAIPENLIKYCHNIAKHPPTEYFKPLVSLLPDGRCRNCGECSITEQIINRLCLRFCEGCNAIVFSV